MSTLKIGRPELHISTKAAKVNIKHNRPRLKIRHRHPKMQIRRKAPVFKIVRSSSAIKANSGAAVQISQRFTRNKISNDSNFTERIVSFMNGFGPDLESDDLSVETSALKQIEAQNKKSARKREDISIEWERGYFEIDWTQSIMEIEWDVDPYPEITVEPHDIEIYVKTNISRNQKKKMSHAFPGSQVDKKV